MASSDIVPALQQGLLQKETESRTGVYSSQNPTSITGGEQGVVPHSNVTSPTISKNQSVVSIAERKADVSVQGVRIQAHNLAIRTESAKLHASGPTPGEPQINNQHQLPNVQAALPSAQATDTDRAIVPQTPRSPVLQDGAGQAVAHLERTGEAAKRSDELNIQTLQIQIDDLEIGIVRGEAIVQGERQVVRQEIETTDDGKVSLRQHISRERVFYRRVIEVIYISALNKPEDPAEEKLKTSEKCIDCCCQAFSCKSAIVKLFSGRRENQKENKPKRNVIEKIEYMTPILRRGRAYGWKIFENMVFPLVKDWVRFVWVLMELILLIVSLSLSIASFNLGKDRDFNIFHLALTILGSILSFFDGVLLLKGSSYFKKCGACSSGDTVSGESEEKAECRNDQQCSAQTPEHKKNCKECLKATKDFFDVIRIILAEFIFYPLLICDIFELITSETYNFDNAADGISFFLFVISLVLVIFYVYVMRIVILIAANSNSLKKRAPSHEEEKDTTDFDYTVQKTAKYFQYYFVVHVIVQMVAQILMIIAIGAAIREENSHLFQDSSDSESNTDEQSSNTDEQSSNTDEQSMGASISVSGPLWYMLVAGYVMPFFGIFTFFISTYFWTQEFPIGICVDALSILELPDIDSIMDIKAAKDKTRKKINQIRDHIQTTELNREFNTFRKTAFIEKLGYPFQSPQMVILSIIYAGLQLAFVICAVVTINNANWAPFYVLAGIFGFFANFFVFAIATLWMIIIITILLVIITIIILILFVCIICCITSSSNNDN